LWERKDRPVTQADFRLRDVYGRTDWPGGMDDKLDSAFRARDRLIMQEMQSDAEDAQREQEEG